jgi:hypothetical protein
MGTHRAYNRLVVRLRALLLSLSIAAAGCASETATSPNGAEQDSEFKAGDFAEGEVLPYAGDWLDAPRALNGIGQFDRLKGTIHDDAKCSTMVAVAAALIGGREHFTSFLDAVARLRAGRAEDLAVIDDVRAAAAERRLTPRHIHQLTEAVVRAYGVANGAFDGQISRMVRASGYVPVQVGSKVGTVLVAHLEPHEVVPLATIADGEAHITLLWMDGRGTVRLYDSDDIHNHVMARGSAAYRVRVEDPRSTWDLAQKYR